MDSRKWRASMRLLAVLQDFLWKMITTAHTIYLYCQADKNKNKTKQQQQKLIWNFPLILIQAELFLHRVLQIVLERYVAQMWVIRH